MQIDGRKKGQAATPDFVLSLAIFLVIIVGSAIIWNTVAVKSNQFRDNNFMQNKIFSITDTLVRTEGYPLGWNSTNVRLIGLSERESHILNKTKVLELKNAGPVFVKSIWGIGGYEYYARFTNSSGDVMVLDGTLLEYGTAPANPRDLVPIKRLVLINDSGTLRRAALTFMIWRQ